MFGWKSLKKTVVTLAEVKVVPHKPAATSFSHWSVAYQIGTNQVVG